MGRDSRIQKFRKNQEHNQIFLIFLYVSSQMIFYKFHSMLPYFSPLSSFLLSRLYSPNSSLLSFSSLVIPYLLFFSPFFLTFLLLFFSLLLFPSSLSQYLSTYFRSSPRAFYPILFTVFFSTIFVSESAPSRQFTCWTLGLRSDQQHWLLSPRQVCSSHSFPLIAF